MNIGESNHSRSRDARALHGHNKKYSSQIPRESAGFKVAQSENFGLMVVPIVRLLSLANQLCAIGKRVTLTFLEGESGAMGYLDRLGFFDHLSPNAIALPSRPLISGAKTHFGGNSSVVEIEAIRIGHNVETLPNRLEAAINSACCARTDVQLLAKSAWQIFSELVGNIELHSQSQLDGYAALQVYRNGNALQVTVSDSGVGIMETLRPALKELYPEHTAKTDVDLLVEVFRQGLSRDGHGHGCGLRTCAEKAIRFRAELDVRLPRQRVLLVPGVGGYRPNTAYCADNLPLLRGTHIAFKFELT
jgi:hypothetical protein